MKKVLVVDWLDKYGGAERVISSLCSVFEFQKCYLLTNVMKPRDRLKIFPKENVPIIQTSAKFLGRYFRILLLFFSSLMRSIKIDVDSDIIISSSHAVAKGVKKSRADQLHISYFQARNLKYIWDDYKLYFGKMTFLMKPFIHLLRRQDIKDAQQPDFIVANSHFVKNWVKCTYNREADVIYPPVDLSGFQLQPEKEDYYVAVGRIEPYKRFDLIVDVFNKLDKKLIIVGDGSQLKDLKKKAAANIEFVGFVEANEVFKYISKARCFIHAGIEDFGIAPIEAQACGTPVIAFGFGGVLETIVEYKTGLFFKEHSIMSLMNAIKAFEKLSFNPHEIRLNATKFDQIKFEQAFAAYVDKKITLNSAN